MDAENSGKPIHETMELGKSSVDRVASTKNILLDLKSAVFEANSEVSKKQVALTIFQKINHIMTRESFFFVDMLFSVGVNVYNVTSFSIHTPQVVINFSITFLSLSAFLLVAYISLRLVRQKDIVIMRNCFQILSHFSQILYVIICVECFTGHHYGEIDDSLYNSDDDFAKSIAGHFVCSPSFLAINFVKVGYHFLSLIKLTYHETFCNFYTYKMAFVYGPMKMVLTPFRLCCSNCIVKSLADLKLFLKITHDDRDSSVVY